MSIQNNDRAGAPYWSLKGFTLGMRLALPVAPAMVAFGLAVGAAAAGKGLALIESVLMNLLVYAGVSQLVAMEIWPQRFTLGAITSLAIICAIINARFLLITASLHPWLGPLPAWQVYPALQIVVDPGWLIAMRYRGEGGSDAGVLLGSSGLLWVAWMSASTAGYLLGAQISDPRRFGIDLVMPLFFSIMLVPIWRGRRRALAWAAAGVVALVVQQLVGGYWFIVAGALAGSVLGGFLDDAA
jgi:predicted branched-subunit amino acid permease